MAIWDEYRAKATELSAKAACQTDWIVRSQFEHLACAYERLAAQAERNSKTDIVYEPPPRQSSTEDMDH